MGTNTSRIAPLTGLAYLVLAIIAVAVSGEGPDPSDDSAREIVDFYADNEGAQIASVALATLASAAFVFFGAHLRTVLNRAEGGDGMLGTAAFAGTIIVATGLAIDSTITVTLLSAAEDIDPAAVQALSALYSNDFIPFVVGTLIFSLASGLAIVRHGGLPKWMGWVAIALAVISVTPIGFVGFIGTGLLVGVMSVTLALRAGRAGTAA